MNIYTRTGDEGKTSVIGARVDKDDLRVRAYGTIDEVNCFVGQAITQLDANEFQDMIHELLNIQHELFDCGGDVANLAAKRPFKVTDEMITFLETRIDAYIKEAPPLEKFILPGGTKAAASIHLARTVARRAERELVSLQKRDAIHPLTLKYINRLSDYFFALARVINARQQVKDIEYERSALVFKRGKRKETK